MPQADPMESSILYFPQILSQHQRYVGGRGINKIVWQILDDCGRGMVEKDFYYKIFSTSVYVEIKKEIALRV